MKIRVLFVSILLSLLVMRPSLLLAKSSKITVTFFSIKPKGSLSYGHVAWTFRLTRWAFKRGGHAHILPTKKAYQKLLYIEPRPAHVTRILKQARQFYEKGKALFIDKEGIFKERKYPYSLKSLQKAQQLAESQIDWLQRPDLLRNIYLYEAMNYMGLRQGAQARSMMMKAIYFDPIYDIEMSPFSAYVKRYYKLLQNWIMKQPTFKFAIRTIPRGAKIYFNGRFIGKSPYLLRDIPAAKYHFRIEAPGFLIWRRTLHFGKGKLTRKLYRPAPFKLQYHPKSLNLADVSTIDKSAITAPILEKKLRKMRKKLNVHFLYVLQAENRQGHHLLRIVSIHKNGRIHYYTLKLGRSRRSHRRVILKFAAQEHARWKRAR